MKPSTRIVLLSVGVLIVGFESDWFTQSPSWVAGVVAFFLILPALFGGRTQG